MLPLAVHLADEDALNPNLATFAALVRVRAGTSFERVTAAVDAVTRVVNERNPQVPVKLYPTRLHDDLVAPVRPVLVTLGIAAVVLILVLTVNFSSLLLARAAERDREFAVSRALGANGSAIVRAMVIEGASWVCWVERQARWRARGVRACWSRSRRWTCRAGTKSRSTGVLRLS